MKIKHMKVGYAVKVHNKESMFFSDGKDNKFEHYDMEAKFIPELNECVIEITHFPSGSKTWTTFANVVYVEPHLETVKSVASGEPKAVKPAPRRAIPGKPAEG